MLGQRLCKTTRLIWRGFDVPDRREIIMEEGTSRAFRHLRPDRSGFQNSRVFPK